MMSNLSQLSSSTTAAAISAVALSLSSSAVIESNISNAYEYLMKDNRSSIIESYENTSEISNDDKNIYLFNIIKAKYEINYKDELNLEYLLRTMQVPYLETSIIKLRRVIFHYTDQVPKLTIFDDDGKSNFLVTISAGDDIDKGLDMFDSIRNEWFAESAIDINQVLFLDIVV